MTSIRMNVLVYSGTGSTVESVRHCLYTLRRFLSPHYAVIPVSADQIVKEPWPSTCAAVIFPGGADQGYCRSLNGEGNRRIRRFVEAGGAYIGFCAGGYYGSRRCEFEVGNKLLEVIGDRELAFFPGTNRGGAFAGFVYHSEKGARAAALRVHKTALSTGSVPSHFRSYYNGGGVFVDAPRYQDSGIEILASYTEELVVDAGQGTAAVVFCKVGKGGALLTGPHPEFVLVGDPIDNWSLIKSRFAAAKLDKKEQVPGFNKVVDLLAEDEKHRTDFMRACLTKLGLSTTDEQDVPPLSHMYLSSSPPSASSELVQSLEGIIKTEDEEEYINDDNDRFHLVNPSIWALGGLYKNLPSVKSERSTKGATESEKEGIVDYSTITKEILLHDNHHPTCDETPYFDHNSFYSALSQYQRSNAEATCRFGNHLLYGEVVTSTNTLLEKNTQLLRRLPTGLTAVATCQLAGRGRGSNVWVSPPGSLMFSTVIRHPMSAMEQAPVVFVQYLAALAVVEGIKTYDGDNYKNLPVKLKWPNDIYALDPTKTAHLAATNANTNSNDTVQSARTHYVKIGGILVNSHYNSQDYIAVCGVGLNLSNALPTTSLNALLPLQQQQSNTKSSLSLPAANATFTPEKLLARILTVFDGLYTRFLRTGFDARFEEMYYEHWLHGGQVVTLEAEGGMKARIQGITRDFGLLVAEEVVEMNEEEGRGEGVGGGQATEKKWRGTGHLWRLQSDSNSFDFFRGLVKRKL